MSALLVTLAEAVKEALNGHVFTPTFTAARVYAPVYKLSDMDTLHVSVAPRAKEKSRAGRTTWQHNPKIEVAVQKRFESPAACLMASDEGDGLMALVEAIDDYLSAEKVFSADPSATLIDIDNDPVFNPAHLRVLNQFTSVLTLNLSLVK